MAKSPSGSVIILFESLYEGTCTKLKISGAMFLSTVEIPY